MLMLSQSGPVKVLVCTSLPDPLYQRVTSVDGRAEVADGAALLLAELPAALRPGQQPPPEREHSRGMDQLLAEAEVILSARRLPPNLVSRAPRLRWVQLPMAGVDWVMDSDLWKNTRVIITNAAGVAARPYRRACPHGNAHPGQGPPAHAGQSGGPKVGQV